MASPFLSTKRPNNIVDGVELKGCIIGIDLLDNTRIIGTVYDWDDDMVWVVPLESDGVLDIPKNLCQRMLISLNKKD